MYLQEAVSAFGSNLVALGFPEIEDETWSLGFTQNSVQLSLEYRDGELTGSNTKWCPHYSEKVIKAVSMTALNTSIEGGSVSDMVLRIW